MYLKGLHLYSFVFHWIFPNILINKYGDALCVLKRVTLIFVCVPLDFSKHFDQ